MRACLANHLQNGLMWKHREQLGGSTLSVSPINTVIANICVIFKYVYILNVGQLIVNSNLTCGICFPYVVVIWSTSLYSPHKTK